MRSRNHGSRPVGGDNEDCVPLIPRPFAKCASEANLLGALMIALIVEL